MKLVWDKGIRKFRIHSDSKAAIQYSNIIKLECDEQSTHQSY
ncbi:hypothetical protein LINPERPRIM_LOCUS28910 [Linum perenne]